VTSWGLVTGQQRSSPFSAERGNLVGEFQYANHQKTAKEICIIIIIVIKGLESAYKLEQQT